ncbi:MAG: restriction endonuclease [Candidatus Aenigmarchaeota archaeon]|nr:restriction endonuclease [Candidatus Aenigmarchaeota archaeon]
MFVIKANGESEKFDKKKIIRTCMRAELPMKEAKEVANKIEKNVTSGTSTKRIYKLILKELQKYSEKSMFVYRIREAIARMDSEVFEKFVEKLLEEHGYMCSWNRIIKGEIVEHQVDLIAKNEMSYLVECKKHANPHRDCGLGETMEVWARLDDINRGGRNHFDKAWIITNTKFSEHAKRYAEGKKIRLTGWRYKEEDSLENLVKAKKLYPVAILSIDKRTVSMLEKNGFITIKDVIKNEKKLGSKFGKKLAYEIVQQSGKLL